MYRQKARQFFGKMYKIYHSRLISVLYIVIILRTHSADYSQYPVRRPSRMSQTAQFAYRPENGLPSRPFHIVRLHLIAKRMFNKNHFHLFPLHAEEGEGQPPEKVPQPPECEKKPLSIVTQWVADRYIKRKILKALRL